ncbi:M23 family metallopeptidase [Sphingomicrobium sediminis]|uniref:M23 family metallopeptidase n=1 Tax=Sphingomicrobium sediminis TaxID=2950949 RepID=A0A9X2EN48_9SPHN|nr:M23 family metallopeptidase [Sphingomicrobium sediminis]MCM8558257.1 M23 family metallopeptidase [Sphingomicrobium sediminis]
MLALALIAAMVTQPTPEERAAMEARANPEVIRQATLHPLFEDNYMCSEHWAGQLMFPGDALGQDCMITGGIEERGYASPYRTDGATNEDWYGWGRPVLAPLSGTVRRIMVNDVVNVPGELGTPPANAVMIAGEDGVNLIVAHLGEILVAEGDMVDAGQQIGTVGNNGFGRAPHIQIGAWDEESALQIRWDLKAIAALYEEPSE